MAVLCESGVTAIWEHWNSLNGHGMISGTEMNSLNHYAYSSVSEFLYAYAVGIRSEDKDFSEALIAQEITGRLRYMRCAYRSGWSRYCCNWEILESVEVKVHIEIPFGFCVIGRGEMRLVSGQHDFCCQPDRDFRCIYGENSFFERHCLRRADCGNFKK